MESRAADLASRLQKVEGSPSGADFTNAVNAAIDRTVLTQRWFSHDPTKSLEANSVAIPLGLFHVNVRVRSRRGFARAHQPCRQYARLQGLYDVAIADSGCNSGVAFRISVSARWGVAPVPPFNTQIPHGWVKRAPGSIVPSSDLGVIRPCRHIFGGAAPALENQFQLMWLGQSGLP
jgi:hypothetical protein